MINTPAKILLGLAAFSGVTAVVYGVASGDRSGAVLLASVMVAALLAALAVMGSAGADPLDAPEDEEAAAPVTYGPVDAARPSPWPLLTALTAGLFAIGAAEGVAWVVAGLILAIIVTGGWTAQVWTEHPSWTPRLSNRLGQRVMVPGLLPVVAVLTTAMIAISLSRALLAVSKDGSVVIAIVVAVVILFACFFVAYRPHLGPGAIIGLVVVGALLAGSAGVIGAAAGEREIHPEEEEGPAFTIVAKNTTFDKDKIDVPAAEDVRVTFKNEDEVFHNFAVYTPDGKPVFASRPVNDAEEEFDMKIADAGDYTFVCDFHPNMKGDLVAE